MYFETIHELQKGLRVLSWIEELSIIGSIDDDSNVLFSVSSCASLIYSFLTLNYPKFTFHIHAINNIKLTQDLKGRAPLLSFSMMAVQFLNIDIWQMLLEDGGNRSVFGFTLSMTSKLF